MIHKSKQSTHFSANILTNRGVLFNTKPRGFWNVECFNPDGSFKWVDPFENLVVNEGLDYLLSSGFNGGAQVDPWYIGLLGASPTVLPGWTATEIAANDFVDFDEATLQEFVESAVSSQSIDNSANKATFTISTNGSTVGGCYLISTDAKGTPSGTVYCAGAFGGGNKSVDNGDTLQVTVTLTTADDGV